MIRVFYGDDRIGAQREAGRVLGEDYEVVEGERLGVSDMASLFWGTSLFGEKRRILVKDLGENGACWGELSKYLDSEHEVVIWESKLDKRTVVYKELTARKLEVREFKVREAPEKKLVFDILDMAWRGDGRRAVESCEKIEVVQDPYMFMGLMVSQALKKLEMGNRDAGRVVRVLADCDMKMKSTGLEPWVLIKAGLVEIGSGLS